MNELPQPYRDVMSMRYYTFIFGSPHSSGLEDHAFRSDGSLAPGGSAKKHICIAKNDRGGKVFFPHLPLSFVKYCGFSFPVRKFEGGREHRSPSPGFERVCVCVR